MSGYVTYYEIHNRAEWESTPDEYKIGLSMVEIGRPDEEDVIVFHVLEDADTAGLKLATCDDCLFTEDSVFMTYPSLHASTTAQTEAGPVEVPRLKPHGWC